MSRDPMIKTVDGSVAPKSQIALIAGRNRQFTKPQLDKYMRIFKMFDVNGNGLVEAGELHAVSEVLGYRFPKDQVQDLLRYFNIGPGGALDFEGFIRAMPGNTMIPQGEHEKAEIRRKFMEYDKDRNGYISKEEAHMVLSKELGFTKDQSDVLLGQFDVNADLKLSYEEFVVFYQKVQEKRKAIHDTFDRFDSGGKGYLSKQDAYQAFQGLFSRTEVDKLFKLHDTNNDGRLQYTEFARFWSAGTR